MRQKRPGREPEHSGAEAAREDPELAALTTRPPSVPGDSLPSRRRDLLELNRYCCEETTMEFEHEHHKEIHEKVHRYLEELFDEPYLDSENGHFYVGYGSTILEISVEPYGPEETIAMLSSFCVQGVERQEDLLLGLLELNHELPLGAFSLVGDDVFYSYAMFGRSLDRKSLLGAIAAVATISDDYDNRIVDMFGGQTALDRIQDTGGRRKRKNVKG